LDPYDEPPVDLAAKLQLKPGMTIAVVGAPDGFDVGLPEADVATAAAILAFSSKRAALVALIATLQESARAGHLTWIAYPKAGKLGTDLNRDSLRESVLPHGLDTVRQVAIDDTWSAIRLKSTP
jgi:hypothetical protein